MTNAPNVSSKYWSCQPPRSNPPVRSSSGSPGACITPSRVRNSLTTIFGIAGLLSAASIDPDRLTHHRSPVGRAASAVSGRGEDVAQRRVEVAVDRQVIRVEPVPFGIGVDLGRDPTDLGLRLGHLGEHSGADAREDRRPKTAWLARFHRGHGNTKYV